MPTQVFDPIDAAATGWTFVTGGNGSYSAVSDGAGGFWLQDSAGFSFNRYAIRSDAGNVNGATQAIEIVVKWKQRAGETDFSTSFWRAFMCLGSNDGSVITGYGCGPSSTTNLTIKRLSASGSYIDTLGDFTPSFTFTANVFYVTRFRRETNGVFKASVWRDGTDTEPGAYQITTAADTTHTTGYIGSGGYEGASEVAIDYFGYGLDAAAPTSGGGGGPALVSPLTFARPNTLARM